MIRGLLVALLLAGLPAPLRAQVSPARTQAQALAAAPVRQLRGLDLSLALLGGRRLGSGYALFDRDALDGGGALEVTYDLAALGPATRLAVGGGVQGEAFQSDPGQTVVGTLKTRGLYATAIARFRADATWQPYAGLAAGVERGELTLSPSAGQVTPEALGAFGRASLGIRFAPRKLVWKGRSGDPLLALALGLEASGTLGTPLTFSYQPEIPSQGAGDGDRVATTSVPLGHVSRHGVHGRGLVTVTF
jgi:hypothetical protein